MSEWVISKARRYDGRVKALFVETMDGENVCDLYHDNGKELEPFPNDRGNANLIVGAPGLLASAKNILAKLDSEHASVTQWDADELRAAIAKAEGAK